MIIIVHIDDDNYNRTFIDKNKKCDDDTMKFKLTNYKNNI